MPNGGDIRNTDLRNTKSVSQSCNDGQTGAIRKVLKTQIEYDYFEDNYPEDITGIDAIIDSMVDMLSRRSTKINGVDQSREALIPYIGRADSCTIREFLEHMREKKMKNIKNINSYWCSAFINFSREQELLKLTV
jgi:hypothetical protein